MTSTLAPVSVHPGFKRSITLPTRLQRLPSAQPEHPTAQASGAETLFTHPSVKIVSFSASSTTSRPSSSSGLWLSNPIAAGSLPWSSRSERIVAVGPLRLYSLPGSYSFLQAGSLLLSLLPRSQCWCVDGRSNFAMVIQNLIYRIELPCMSENEESQIEEFKGVLKKVLQFENTPCPFVRELEQGPVQEQAPPPRRFHGPYQKAKRWDFDDIWKRVGAEESFTPRSQGSSPDTSDEEGSTGAVTDNTLSTRKTSIGSGDSDETKTPIRPRHFQTNRSVTVPLIFGIGASPRHYSLGPLEEGEQESTPRDDRSLSSSLDSFHTSYESLSASTSYESLSSSPLSSSSLAFGRPATPELYSADIDHVRVLNHTRDDSETTITSITPSICKIGALGTELRSDPIFNLTSQDLDLNHGCKEAHKLPSPARQKHSELLNPIYERPKASINHNIFTASRSSSPSDNIVSALVSKTCALLLSPPSNLLAIMMEIAARIANGALAGVAGVYRFRPKDGNWYKVPGKWEDSDDDMEKDDWSEDDYDVSLSNENPERTRRKQWSEDVD